MSRSQQSVKAEPVAAVIPTVSEGHDREVVLNDLTGLLANGWKLDDASTGITKDFTFKSWTRCLDFVNSIGLESKTKNHHPTIKLTYGLVEVHWTTHKPHGLSTKDTEMASYCDEQAIEISTAAKKA